MGPEEAQRLIDEEILDLKTRRNTYARISRLPNELLVEVFTILQGGDDNCVKVGSWHYIAHVCRHWRRIALESVTLWTRPPTHLHAYTLAMLERSRASPLRIDMSYGTSKATCTAVLSHIGRIESLIIENTRDLFEHFQRTLSGLAQEAPLLRTLEMTREVEYTGGGFQLSAPIVHRFPSLKTFRLFYIDFDWITFPGLRSVTSLSLIGVELSKNPSWTQFYSVLRQMPSLKDLGFRFDDLQLTLPPHQGIEPLHLPCLQKLVIDKSRASITHSFLSNASFPRLRNASLVCSFSETPGVNEYPTIIGAVLRLITEGSFGCLDQLVIAGKSFTVSKQADSANQCAATHAIDFTAVDWRNSNSIEIPRALMAGLAALPTNPTLQMRCLSLSVDLASQQILKLFGHLPRLESITGNNVSSRTIIESFKILPLHSAEVPIPFPKVNSIELRGVPHVYDYTPDLLEELCKYLKERHRYGAGVSRLSLAWNLTQFEVQRLQEYVADVEYGDPDKNQDDDDISEDNWVN